METLRDLVEEAKRRTILVAILVLIVAYIMSLTSSSVWVNLPVSIVVLAALRRLSFEVEFRWKPRSNYGRSQPPLRQSRHQLTNYDPLLSGLPCQVAATRWRRIIDSPVVEEAVDQLTRSVIDEFITSLWYNSITPDKEVPEEVRILLNGVIAEVANRAKQVNLVTLLSQNVVDLVGSHFELFRQMKAKIGPDLIESMSTEERDEKLRRAMIASRVLHPAVLSPDAEHKVLKKLTGGVVALVLKRQDSHCRLLRTLARELLACAVLRPVLNFASPGYINELIECALISKAERERLRKEKADELARQRIPDPIPRKIPSQPGLKMESKLGTSDTYSLQKDKEKISKTLDDVGASTLPHDTWETVKQIYQAKATEQAIFNTAKEVGSNWAQVLDAVAQRRAQALAPENLDNVWAKGQNYKKRESEKRAAEAVPVPVNNNLVNNPVSPDTVQVGVAPDVVSGEEVFPSGELSKDLTSATIPMKADYNLLDIPVNQGKNSSEQYALLSGDSKDREERISGIGFSPHPSSQALYNPRNIYQARNDGGPELVRFDNEDLLGSSANSQSTTDISGQSPSRARYHYKTGSSSQRLKRAVRLLAHRKSKSSGGTVDGWNGLEVGSSHGLRSFLSPGEGSPVRSPGSESRWRTLLHGEISPVTSPGSESRWRSLRKSHSPDVSVVPVQADTELMTNTQSTMLNCQVLGAHFDRVGSKPFAVYSIQVKDTENRTWRIQRRFRNFEQLHRRLKDMPYYNLTLPSKRFLSSSLDNNFVRERCIFLDKYLKDLLAIPSVAELHEVWDFLSENSQYYTYGNSVSMMRTLAGKAGFPGSSFSCIPYHDLCIRRKSLPRKASSSAAVNVDDAVDDMFRQIRGVSDDISGVLKTATTGIRHRLPTGGGYSSDGATRSSTEEHPARTSASLATRFPLMTTYLTDSEVNERIVGASVSEDEYGGNVNGLESYGWQSDSDLQTYSSDSELLRNSRRPFVSGSGVRQGGLDNRFDDTFSDGHSPVGSNVSETVPDDLVMPNEWTPPKVSVPLLNLVDILFQLQNRGWIRRQVLWMAKQILQLVIGDAIDVWLLGRIQWLRREEVVASGIRWVTGILWPDGIFFIKHPRGLPEASVAMLESLGIFISEKDKAFQPRPLVNSFEYRLEAARRAGIVREAILEKAPTAVVNLIGRKQYAKCAKDIFYFSQSTVCIKHLTYCLLEMLVTSAFPELQDLVLDIHSSVI